MAENTSNGAVYKITFVNNSPNSGTFMIFQQPGDTQIEGAASLAWITKYAHPGTQGTITWTEDYNFVWSENDSFAPGINISTSQCPSADLETTNSITLTYVNGYNFIDQGVGPQAGSLFIKQDSTIPLDQATVGIGMSGAGTFSVPAQPNMELTFTTHPEYWMAFGEFSEGQALNVQEITNTAQVNFPPGIDEMKVILNADNSFTVEPA